MTSSLQTVPLVQVYDYLYQAGYSSTPAPAEPNVVVTVTLNFNQATYSNPVVALTNQQYRATTDSNGYWTVYVPANDLINPSGTLYTVRIPGYAPYDISVPSTSVPVGGWQSSAIVVNTPSSLGASAFNLPSPVTATGILNVNGNARFHGPDPWFDATHPTFGATGGGSVDDTASIQAAITAAVNAGGGIVYLPPGTYLTSSTLTATHLVHLVGSGWNTVIKNVTAGPIIQLQANTADTEDRGALISDLRIDGGAAANALTGLLVINYAASASATTARTSVVDRVQFTNCGTGVRLVNTQGLAIRDCKFGWNGNGTNGNTLGLYISDNAQIGVVEGCDFRDNVTGMKLEASNAIITPAVADRIYSWAFVGCHWELNSGQGVVLDGASYNTFTSCKWEQNTGTFLTVQNTVSGFRSDLNTFTGCVFNGNPSVPTVVQVALTQASGTQFNGCQFNSGNNAGITIGAGAFHTMFMNSATGSAIADSSTSTSYFNPYASQFALERTPFALTDAAPVTIDASKGDVQTLLTTAAVGNARTLSAPTNVRPGQQITFLFTQDGSGGRNITPFSVKQSTFSNVGNTANATAAWTVTYDGTNWWQVSFTPYNKDLVVGSLTTGSVTKTGTYTITVNDHTIWADATTAPFTVTLPNATFSPGIEFEVKKIDSSANAVTVAGGGTNIDAAATKVLAAQYNAVTVRSSGTQWMIMSNV